jgi:hypothetical protein
MRIWVTEYGYQTNPPDSPAPERQAGALHEAGLTKLVASPTVDMMICSCFGTRRDGSGWQSGYVRRRHEEAAVQHVPQPVP